MARSRSAIVIHYNYVIIIKNKIKKNKVARIMLKERQDTTTGIDRSPNMQQATLH